MSYTGTARGRVRRHREPAGHSELNSGSRVFRVPASGGRKSISNRHSRVYGGSDPEYQG